MTTRAYEVADDVPFVNGAPVPKARVVHLTDAEAAFDLGLGRIKLNTGSKPALRRRAIDAEPTKD